jgi:hypothetical protein
MFLRLIPLLLFLAMNISAQEMEKVTSDGQTFPGPVSPQDREAWLAALKQVRTDWQEQVKYDGSLYSRPELAWTQRSPDLACLPQCRHR